MCIWNHGFGYTEKSESKTLSREQEDWTEYSKAAQFGLFEQSSSIILHLDMSELSLH